MAESFTSDFKRFFARGLAILLPTAVTLWLLWQAFGFVYNTVAQPINKATRITVIWVVPKVMDEEKLPEWFQVTESEIAEARANRPEIRDSVNDASVRLTLRREYLQKFWREHAYLNLTGLFIAIMLIYLAGVLLGNIVGKSIYARVERLITRIPGFKQVYPHVKQVVDMIMGEKKMAFSKVVIVEYPREGVWTVGFLTGNSIREIDEIAGNAVVSVFIPTSPTPFTGFTINLPKSKVFELSMTIEEALRFVITAGVLAPGDMPQDKSDPALEALARQAEQRNPNDRDEI
ncbi:MAG: hypothetical protein CMJ35_05280 [Phycisphaerae bacterium]|nr:hypothetical protein [Phycisphaerae bacterium]MBM91014.1 hypothetical protein [Phycisphaerae bacterium]|tara:strand:+ start:47 stop:916 length:870 start_codon:yes stop_codon:yes gene_type:complete